jgi:phosphatidylserine/phosphatidylglycerophosphate/cardiolipin synthase-like enzyme
VSGVQVFIEPGAGAKPVVRPIATATSSGWVELYLLTDLAVIDALEEAANRHVEVRMPLEAHPFGSGDVSAQKSLNTLKLAGVQARAACSAFTYTHAKAMLIDQATLYILTGNLTRSGLGGSPAQVNRDFRGIETDAQDVAEAVHIFQADWDHTHYQPSASHLLVSLVNAQAGILGLIGGAQQTLHIGDEEMFDTAFRGCDDRYCTAWRGRGVAAVDAESRRLGCLGEGCAAPDWQWCARALSRRALALYACQTHSS